LASEAVIVAFLQIIQSLVIQASPLVVASEAVIEAFSMSLMLESEGLVELVQMPEAASYRTGWVHIP
jgi:hypothetical protein